jgi:magnesium chelatase accessory protein
MATATGTTPAEVLAHLSTEIPADLPADWPHRACSRCVDVQGQRWHLQIFGAPGPAPDVLLLHGAGASAHSWRDLAPVLAAGRRVIVPDLPGHGWTARPAAPRGLSLPGMAGLLGALLRALGCGPVALVGHSAGAAVAARMVLDGLVDAQTVVGLNGAWLPPARQGRWFYGPLARLLVLNPLVPPLVAWTARQGGPVQRLVDSTGSRLDARGVALYAQLVRRSAHVSAVMAMMAAWDLEPLLRDLPRLQAPLHLLVADGDLTVPAVASVRASERVPSACWHPLPGLGHLAHEEAPALVLRVLEAVLGPPGDGVQTSFSPGTSWRTREFSPSPLAGEGSGRGGST